MSRRAFHCGLLWGVAIGIAVGGRPGECLAPIDIHYGSLTGAVVNPGGTELTSCWAWLG
jgi:hypothetical protein